MKNEKTWELETSASILTDEVRLATERKASKIIGAIEVFFLEIGREFDESTEIYGTGRFASTFGI